MRRRRLRRLAVLAAWALAAGGVAGAARAASRVRLPADATVLGATVRLGEIAAIEAPTASLRAALEALELGPAAPPGRHRSFRAEAIAAAAAAVDPAVRLEAPAVVRVHTAYREVRPEALRELLERALRMRAPWPAEALRLERWSLPPAVRVHPGATRTIVRFAPTEDFLGPVAAEIEILDPARPEVPSVRLRASVHADAILPVLVARRELRRGATLDGDAVAAEPRSLAALPRDALLAEEPLEGVRLARRVPAGTVLRRAWLDRPPAVRRGGPIAVVVAEGALELRATLRALEDGAIGDTVRAENPSTRRRLLVRVTGAGTGELALPGVGTAP